MTRTRQLVAFLIAAAADAGNEAAAQSFTLYGRLYPELILTRMTGATAPGATGLSTLAGAPSGASFDSVTKMDASNSRLGVRAEEPLGNGVKAFFQIESRILVDTGNPPNTGIASRDTFVGLSSERLGLVKFGNMDTVYKSIGDTLSFLGVSSGNFVSNSSVLAKQGFGESSAGSFHLRRTNALWYETPSWNGLQWMVQYGPDEARTTTRNAWLGSTGVLYDSAQVYAALSYEHHHDFFGGSRNVPGALSNTSNQNAHSNDWSSRGTLQYRWSSHTVEGNVAYTRYAETGGANGRFRDQRHWSGALSLDSKWSDTWRTAASVDVSASGSCSLFGGVPCRTDGLEGHQLSLGAAYYLSRRTSVFALYAKLWNGRSAQYNNVDGIDMPVGADPQQLAVGLMHSF